MLIKLTDVQHNINIFYEGYKTMSIFNAMQQKETTYTYVQSYLKNKNITFSWQFVFNFLSIYAQLRPTQKSGNIGFSFESAESYSSFLDYLCINTESYQIDKKNHINDIGIKEKSLLKIKNKYYIIDWFYFLNQLYTGFLFDFYKNSGIHSIYKSFSNFKSHVGHKISEKVFFVPIMNSIFKRKHRVVLSEIDSKDGFPDLYIRDNKFIYIFEFKDSMMPNHIQCGYDFDL